MDRKLYNDVEYNVLNIYKLYGTFKVLMRLFEAGWRAAEHGVVCREDKVILSTLLHILPTPT